METSLEFHAFGKELAKVKAKSLVSLGPALCTNGENVHSDGWLSGGSTQNDNIDLFG